MSPIRQDFADLIKSQSEIWHAQIKVYEEQFSQGSKEAIAEHEKAVAQMKAYAEQATILLERVKSTQEAAWKDLGRPVQDIFIELQKGWAEAVSRIK